MWKFRTGTAWRDVPERYGSWHTLHTRFRRWALDGTFERMLETAQARADAAGDEEMTGQARAAGQAVETTVEGSPEQAPAAHRLAAYRLVREALTNARKHAPDAPVRVRLGLTDLLDSDDAVEVVAQAADGLHAVEQATVHRVDVALVDVRMPRMDGIAATRRLRALPHPPKVITLTTFDLDQYVHEALAAGADGFLLKDTEPAEILRAVHLVAAGSAMLHPAAARRLIDRYHHAGRPRATRARARVAPLTPRGKDVLALLAQGDTNADIAQALGMRESTVKSRVSRILTALGVTNRVQAALLARDAGLAP